MPYGSTQRVRAKKLFGHETISFMAKVLFEVLPTGALQKIAQTQN